MQASRVGSKRPSYAALGNPRLAEPLESGNLFAPGVASVFDELSFWSARFGTLLFKHLELVRGIGVLDLACGTGFPLFEMSQVHGDCSKFIGVDLEKEALERASVKLRTYRLRNVSLIRADAAHLPLSDGSFDRVVSHLGINNFADQRAVLAECSRVATSEARLVLTTNLNGQMREFYERVELHHVRAQSSPRGILLGTAIKISSLWAFYIGPALTLPLFLFPKLVSDRRIRFLVIATGACFVGNALVAFYGAHYSAPVAAAIVAIVLQGMRHLRLWRVEAKPAGLFLSRAVIAIAILMMPIEVHTLRAPQHPHAWHGTIGDAYVASARQRIVAQLNALPDGELVLVRYRPDHDPMAEWVYNDAEIDHAKIVWARDLGHDQNEELLRYYSSRRVWLLEPDETPPKLTPYVPSEDHKSLTAEHRSGDIRR